jgi:hypothetical protein
MVKDPDAGSDGQKFHEHLNTVPHDVSESIQIYILYSICLYHIFISNDKVPRTSQYVMIKFHEHLNTCTCTT